MLAHSFQMLFQEIVETAKVLLNTRCRWHLLTDASNIMHTPNMGWSYPHAVIIFLEHRDSFHQFPFLAAPVNTSVTVGLYLHLLRESRSVVAAVSDEPSCPCTVVYHTCILIGCRRLQVGHCSRWIHRLGDHCDAGREWDWKDDVHSYAGRTSRARWRK